MMSSNVSISALKIARQLWDKTWGEKLRSVHAASPIVLLVHNRMIYFLATEGTSSKYMSLKSARFLLWFCSPTLFFPLDYKNQGLCNQGAWCNNRCRWDHKWPEQQVMGSGHVMSQCWLLKAHYSGSILIWGPWCCWWEQCGVWWHTAGSSS